RTPEEYTGELGHIDHSLLLPVQELEKRIGELERYKGITILAVCRTGRRSAKATEILTKSGFKAISVEGGMVKWNDMKFPVVRVSK
ncbi:MAG: rhodanese-like domain-containing protein, partial [Bacteroidota bacterium]